MPPVAGVSVRTARTAGADGVQAGPSKGARAAIPARINRLLLFIKSVDNIGPVLSHGAPRIVSVPKAVLIPAVLVLCVLGSYTLNSIMENVYATLLVASVMLGLWKHQRAQVRMVLPPELEVEF